MTKKQLKELEQELERYVEYLTKHMGRPERCRAMGQYLMGLMLEGERKSVEPMAWRLADDERQVPALRQRLQQCITESNWPSEEIFRRVARLVDKQMPGLQVWVLDDTDQAKQGRHSVGVARQYSKALGKTGNCQVTVSLHAAGEQGGGCMGMRLYLPRAWTEDRKRCERARVPAEVVFKQKWRIALDLVDHALSWGITPRVMLADYAYGNVDAFRAGLAQRHLSYVVAVSGVQKVFTPGLELLSPPKASGAQARPQHARGRREELSIRELAARLPPHAYRKVTWREGSRGPQWAYFAAVRVQMASRRSGAEPLWLLCEWPKGQDQPTKFYLSNLPASCSRKRLVSLAHLRWRVERDYQDMKSELGLDHFEGRFWTGFHHHAALCAAAHAFLALRKALFPPERHSVPSVPAPPPAPATPAGQASSIPAVPSSL